SSGVSVSFGQVNLVETTAPRPTLLAKSSPPSLSSTWSPAKLLPRPASALKVLPLLRTCQDEVGSEAGYWSVAGRLWIENAVPQGHSSTTASGLASCAARWIAAQNADRPSQDSSGRAWRWAGLWQGATALRCWPSSLRPSKPQSPMIFLTSAT